MHFQNVQSSGEYVCQIRCHDNTVDVFVLFEFIELNVECGQELEIERVDGSSVQSEYDVSFASIIFDIKKLLISRCTRRTRRIGRVQFGTCWHRSHIFTFQSWVLCYLKQISIDHFIDLDYRLAIAYQIAQQKTLSSHFFKKMKTKINKIQMTQFRLSLVSLPLDPIILLGNQCWK